MATLFTLDTREPVLKSASGAEMRVPIGEGLWEMTIAGFPNRTIQVGDEYWLGLRSGEEAKRVVVAEVVPRLAGNVAVRVGGRD